VPASDRSGGGQRIPISLVCSECGARNYKTTKVPSAPQVVLKKHCKACGKHTEHRESR
jgi:large subunit ribosomal protein L33